MNLQECLGVVSFFRKDSNKLFILDLDGESYIAYRDRIDIPKAIRTDTLVWFRIQFGDHGMYKVTSLRLVAPNEALDPWDLQTLDIKLQAKKDSHKKKEPIR